jgi:hypothetical protein
MLLVMTTIHGQLQILYKVVIKSLVKHGHGYFWNVKYLLRFKKMELLGLASKAVDMALNSQPENADHGWNVRGLGNNSWYRTVLKI